jgi:thioredoxin-related protein
LSANAGEYKDILIYGQQPGQDGSYSKICAKRLPTKYNVDIIHESGKAAMVLTLIQQKCPEKFSNLLQLLALSAITISLTIPLIVFGETRTVQEAHDFQALGQEMRARNLPLLLAFRADYCDYCRQLEKTYLEPMAQDSKYDNRIMIRRFSLGKSETITDFNGAKLDADAFAQKYEATLTPTLVFLNTNGEQVAERLLGYNSPDFYGAYLENAIEAAQKAVQTRAEGENGGAPKDTPPK